jgi:hypothetical protein
VDGTAGTRRRGRPVRGSATRGRGEHPVGEVHRLTGKGTPQSACTVAERRGAHARARPALWPARRRGTVSNLFHVALCESGLLQSLQLKCSEV